MPPKFVWRNGGDCVRYINWSTKVANEGFRAFPALVDEWQHRWVGFPPPTRWTYLSLIAGIMRIWPHPTDNYHPLVIISWLAGRLVLFALAPGLRRRVPPEAA